MDLLASSSLLLSPWPDSNMDEAKAISGSELIGINTPFL